MANAIMNINSGMTGVDIFALLGDVTAFVANFGECGIEKAIDDISSYCLILDHCDVTQIMNEITTKAFQMIDKINTIVEVLEEFPGDTSDQIYEEMESMGQAIGGIIRNILSLDNTFGQ